jgi:polar amino acid transport system substrate-binding protein
MKLSLSLPLALVLAPTALADSIVIKADPWCPYTCEASSATQGFLIELAKATLEPKGHKVIYQNLPWARALAETREGKIDAAAGAGPADLEGLIATESLITSASCFLVRKGEAWKYKGVESLKGKTLGAISDYTYTPEIDAYVKANPKSVQLATGEDAVATNIKKVVGKRLDVIIDDENVLAYTSKQMNKSNEVEIAGCAQASGSYIVFAPKNPKSKEYAKTINEALATMQKNGKLDALLAKYGLKK